MFKILIFEESLVDISVSIFAQYSINVARDQEEFLDFTYENKYDLYIVNFHYYNLIQELKDSGNKISTIFVDEFYNIYNLKKAFLIADEYMLQPLHIEELKIRVEYYYRKLFNHSKNIFIYKEYYFHINSKQLFYGTQKIKLSPNEMKLLGLFITYVNKPISKDIIYEKLESSSDGSLRVYISKLNKLGFSISYDRSIVSYTLN